MVISSTGRGACRVALSVRGSPLSRVCHFKVGRIWMYAFTIVWR